MSSSSPVLFLIFNRPDTTNLVFEAIRAARPRQLFIAADGPRHNKPGEKEKCEETRRITEKVDWPCELKTLFRDNNLGCKNSIRGAIDWFFTHVEEGIIIEDDCLPDPSFFGFCSLLLERYRATENVKMISGTNFFFGKFDQLNSYFFSAFVEVWGWATWKRAWLEVSFDQPNFEKFRGEKILERRFNNKRFCAWLYDMMQSTFIGKTDAWSPYVVHSFALRNGLNALPYRNLVSNIGYTGANTNVDQQHPSFKMKTQSIELDTLVHPQKVAVNTKYDQITFRYIVKTDWKKTIAERVINRIKNMIKISC